MTHYENDILVRQFVTSLYCGDLDAYSDVLEEALHRRAAVLAGARDRGPVEFNSKILVVDGKPIVKVTRERQK